MLFFGTVMDMAQMFSPLHFTFKIVAHCGAANHCGTVTQQNIWLSLKAIPL